MKEYCSKNLSKELYSKQLRDWSSKAFYLEKESDKGLYDFSEHKVLLSTGGWFPAYRLSKVLGFFREKLQINIYSFANWHEGTWSTIIQKAFNPELKESTDLILGSAFNPKSWEEAIERGIYDVIKDINSFKQL